VVPEVGLTDGREVNMEVGHLVAMNSETNRHLKTTLPTMSMCLEESGTRATLQRK